jgi:hypothetical protein
LLGYYVGSSPFLTFFFGGGESILVYPMYDIIPGSLVLDSCNKTIPQTLLNNPTISAYLQNSFTNNCNDISTNFCKGDNLLLDQCYNFCNKNSGTCNSVLASYCSDSSNIDSSTATILNTDPNFNRSCSCFLGSSYYTQWQQNVANNLKASGAAETTISDILQANMGNPQCYYPTCSGNLNYLRVPTTQSCPSYNILNCVNNSSLNTQGSTMSDQAKIDANNYNKCTQNVSQQQQTTNNVLNPPGQNPPATPPGQNPPPPPKSGSNTTMIIFGVLTLILVIVLAVYFMKRK